MRGALAAAAAGLCLVFAVAAYPAEIRLLSFSDLEGWEHDDHAAAFAVFNDACPDLRREEWAAICAFATTRPNPRLFFELFFRPVQIGLPAEALVTAYFEPELRASPRPTATYRYPLLAMPAEAEPDARLPTRQEIETDAPFAGLEIAWLRDPLDLYLLQLQGSGRLVMPNGSVVRVGYAGQNGHPRRPIATELVRRGALEPHEASFAAIRTWMRRNPIEGQAILLSDPSYVFFRIIDGLPAEAGPPGAMQRPLAAGRALAVDAAHVPLGAPIWVETDGEQPLRRLMVALDTGGAIRGPQRADIFMGTGPEAESTAQRVRDPGRLIVLLPIEVAYSLAEGG